MSEQQIDAINDLRGAIKDTAADLLALKHGMAGAEAEAVANVMLAYRHLEDASMRLGKVIQALDGGVSVYDKRTTVGA
jgi:D-Tyr-tRNAtyr deacylase